MTVSDTSIDLMLLKTDSSCYSNKGIVANDLGSISSLTLVLSASCWLERDY